MTMLIFIFVDDDENLSLVSADRALGRIKKGSHLFPWSSYNTIMIIMIRSETLIIQMNLGDEY